MTSARSAPRIARVFSGLAGHRDDRPDTAQVVDRQGNDALTVGRRDQLPWTST